MVLFIILFLAFVGWLGYYYWKNPEKLKSALNVFNNLSGPASQKDVEKMKSLADKLEKQADTAEAIQQQRSRIIKARERIAKARA